MRSHRLIPGLLLAAALGVLVSLGTSAGAAENVDNARIAKLIEQLGSSNFEERDRATKELDVIGDPALAALKKAAQSDDLETKCRAQELVKKIESRGESARLLAPTKIHLVYKDVLVKDAVADLAKKTGYPIVLHDPDNKVGERKLTLDTGETTFWEAFDQFCQKAGLVESNPNELVLPVNRPGLQPLPPVRQGQPGVLPVVPPANPAPAQRQGFQVQAQAVPGQAQPAPAPAQPNPLPAAAPIMRRRPINQVRESQLVLVDGKPQSLPTCYAGAARIRALPPGSYKGETPAESTSVLLEVTLEPKLQWEQLVSLNLDKALDDLGQKLAQATLEVPQAAPPVAGGIRARPGVVVGGPIMVNQLGGAMEQQIPVHLKKGDKAAKSLTELKGTISVQVRTPPEAMVTVDKVLKAAGNTTKGENGSSINVLEATLDEKTGQFRLRVQLDYPPDVQPAGANTTIIRALPPQAVPPVPPAPPQGGGGNPPAQLQIQIQVAPAGGGGGAPGAAPLVVRANWGADNGLTLVDDKGQTMQPIGRGMSVRNNGGALTYDYILTYKVDKDQPQPAKLTFMGTRGVTLDIPFTLKNVPLQ